MNSVSFLFYLADIISNFKPVAAFLAVFFFLIAGLPFVFALFGETVEVKQYFKRNNKSYEKTEITFTEWNSLPYNEKASERENVFVRIFPKARLWAWITVPVAIVMMLFANALPSRETIFMIATSEFVEDFSQTQTGTEIGALAKDTLDYLKIELGKLKGVSQTSE